MKTILTLCIFLAIAWNTTAQQTAKQSDSTIIYHNETYSLLVGAKGGKYIVLDDGSRKYISDRVRTASKPVDNLDGTAKYRGADYRIFTGTKNGRYIVYKGSRIYFKS